MRILAIRGRNLASLAGDFEVRFDAPPLRDVGIFAIAGPTGAGKSTLLDALCLALYDRTPRLDGNSGVRVGREDEDAKDRLGDQDTRALLRRGAAEGKAEVDFVGRDGRRYRATWSVRRARGAAGGRLQQVEVAFADLDAGAPLASGTKTETLEAIATKVGLPFDQFRRSVLLAQGDFAAFLQANAGERADLLERMTGTEIYARLSIAAFDRARAENEALAHLETRIGEARPLADDVRADLETERAAAQAEVVRVRADLAAAQQAVAWHARRAQLGSTLAKAAAAAAAADGAWVALGGRGALETPAGLAAAANELDDLRALDQLVALAHAKAKSARGPAERAQAAAQRSAETTARLASDLATLRGRIETAQAWCGQHAALRPVAEAWNDLRVALEAGRKARARAAQAAADLAAVHAEQARHAPAGAAAEAALRRAQGDAIAAEQALAEARRAAAAVDITAARAALDAAVAAERALATMAEAARGVAEKADGAARERADAATARTEARAHDERARVAAASQAVLAGRLDEVRAARERALAARDLAGHRAALVAGESCPLCGATAHPFAAETPAFDTTLADLGARIADLERDRTAAERTATTEAAHARAAERRADDAEHRAAAADGEAETARRRWADARAKAPAGEAPAAPADVAGHATAIAAAATRIEAARAHAAAGDAALGRVTKTAEAHARALHAAGLAKDHGAQLAVEATGREARAAELERTRADAQRDAEATLAALDAPLAPLGAWRADFDRDAAAFVRTRDVELRTFTDRTHALATDQASLPTAARNADDARVLATAAEREAESARAAADAADAAAAELGQTRAARFGGRPTSEVEPSYAAARDAHRAAADRARDLADHDATPRPERSAADAATRATDLEARRTDLDRRLGELAEKFATDDRVRLGLASLQQALDAARTGARTWQDLSGLLGSADGKKFRVFAQSLTLGELVTTANAHLAGLRPRYRLERVPGTDLDLQVVDRDLGDEVRAVASLSGGETFLVSLALALGLSSLSAHDVRLDSLFVDEGFGTLDPDTLESALAVLDELQAEGRQVGLISHVPGLAERLGARVEVRPVGVGTSRVHVLAG